MSNIFIVLQSTENAKIPAKFLYSREHWSGKVREKLVNFCGQGDICYEAEMDLKIVVKTRP